MIPPRFDPEATSPGEAKVFELIQHDPGTQEWTVLHSLDITQHRRQIEGEIDFLILVPGLGILVLEVKGHRSVERGADGMWRLGRDEPTPRSPFEQASENLHSIKDELAQRRPELAPMLFWSAVCFPCANLGDPVSGRATHHEWHPWQLIEKRDLDREPISALVGRALGSAARHVRSSPTGRWFDPKRSLPSEEQCARIAEFFRPRYEVFVSPEQRRRDQAQELRKFTEDQFAVLDAMAQNDRVVFRGAAGTGKTMLAIESARREALDGRRVLLCCFNRLLGTWLQGQLKPHPSVRAGTLHHYMVDTAGVTVPAEPTRDYWQRDLPEQALAKLLDRGAAFDTVIIDEAQDLLTDNYLDVLEASLVGGLRGGRWQFFGDFEAQDIYRSGARPLDDLLAARSVQAARFTLTSNCRNTPRIAQVAELLAGPTPEYRRILRPDNGVSPKVRYYKPAEAQPAVLLDTLEALGSDGYADREIAVLSPSARHACADRLPPEWRARLHPPSFPPKGIQRSTIHSFKGLEAPCVVVTDIETVATDGSDALLYVAATRATERLVLLVDHAVRADLDRLLNARTP